MKSIQQLLWLSVIFPLRGHIRWFKIVWKKDMYCFDQGQRHVTEQDPVMTAKQFMFEESQDHMSQLVAGPSWSTFPCRQHSNGEKIQRVKNGQLACMRINCCFSPGSLCGIFLSLKVTWGTQMFVFFPSSRDLNVCLIVPFFSTTDLNQILPLYLTSILRYLQKQHSRNSTTVVCK